MKSIATTFLKAPLVPVRETQKNITKYFKGGVARVTKNGRSLGYLMSDKVFDELMEDIAASNPHFIARMKKISKDEKAIPLEKVLKEYGIN